ncbi:MAG: hypothetical protein HQK89_12685 [Nitrospirae bacterium]|nr:hypothetical protein [Nitrospirota bacterium]
MKELQKGQRLSIQPVSEGEGYRTSRGQEACHWMNSFYAYGLTQLYGKEMAISLYADELIVMIIIIV